MADPQWWPVDDVRVTAGFGDSPEWYRKNVGQLGHNAIDIGGAWGTPLYAIDDGVVVQEGWNIPWSGEAGGIALMVRSAWGHWGLAHCSETSVSVGDRISRGQRVGSMGATGLVTGVHVHSETLPLSPNFNNGYSGRVNPHVLINLQPRGTSSASTPAGQEEDETMSKNIGMSYSEGGEQKVTIGNLESGFDYSYTTRDTTGKTNNTLADLFQTGNYYSTDKTMVTQFKAALAAVRAGK